MIIDDFDFSTLIGTTYFQKFEYVCIELVQGGLMNVFILSASKLRQFESKLYSSFGKAGINVSDISCSRKGDMSVDEIQKKLYDADLIIAIIDNLFTSDNLLVSKLNDSIDLHKKSKRDKNVIVLIVIGNIPLPFDTTDIPCIVCDSIEGLDNTDGLIVNIINSRDNSFAKKPIETSGRNYSSANEITKIAVRAFVGYFLSKIICNILLAPIAEVFSWHDFGRFDYLNNIILVGTSSLMSLVPISIFIVNILKIIPVLSNIIDNRKIYGGDNSVNSYSNQLAHAIGLDNSSSGDKENKFDALGLMWTNLLGIDKFYQWSRMQAILSFAVAVVTFILGFALIVVAVKVALDPSANYQMTIVPVVGAAITEFISATTLFVYQKSISQLNYYHKSLHENERFLSSVNLIDRFHKDEIQDSILQEIIRNQMQMNTSDFRETIEKGKIRTEPNGNAGEHIITDRESDDKSD